MHSKKHLTCNLLLNILLTQPCACIIVHLHLVKEATKQTVSIQSRLKRKQESHFLIFSSPIHLPEVFSTLQDPWLRPDLDFVFKELLLVDVLLSVAAFTICGWSCQWHILLGSIFRWRNLPSQLLIWDETGPGTLHSDSWEPQELVGVRKWNTLFHTWSENEENKSTEGWVEGHAWDRTGRRGQVGDPDSFR